MKKSNNTKFIDASTVKDAINESGYFSRSQMKENVKKRIKYNYQAFLWILIPMLFLFFFSYYPTIKAVIDSFYDSKVVSSIGGNIVVKDVFVGIDNYKEIFNDRVFWLCIKNVAIFTVVGLVCGNFMTILLAELLFNLKNKKLSAFFRILFIVPILVPSLVIILIWKYVIFGNTGLLNQLMLALGLDRQLWYWETDPSKEWIAKFAIIFTNFPWVGGTSFLIYLAGLQNIPHSVMEASQLDNCSTMKRIFKIDMPFIRSQLKYFLIMGVIGGFQNFDLQLIALGQEYDNTNVLGLYLYDRAFGIGYTTTDGTIIRPRFGYACAVGMIILVITLALTIMNMKLNADPSKTKKNHKKPKLINKEYIKLLLGKPVVETVNNENQEVEQIANEINNEGGNADE